MSRIFISYKRVDKDKVFKIKDQIESALGEKCWIDLDGIESDAQFKNVIIRAINACEIVLFMYSKAHSKILDFEKDWTVRELNFASKKNKRIVFINLDGSPLTDAFEFDYGTKQQVDASSEVRVLKLLYDLRNWMGINYEGSNSIYNEEDKNDVIGALIYASVHKCKLMKERRPIWEKRGLFLFFLPPYSPHLNIAENLWRILKGKWLRPVDYFSTDSLLYATNRALAALGTELNINFAHTA